MYDEEEFLPISLLPHFLFCPRRAALVHIEGLWKENEFTASGAVTHKNANELRSETRPGIRVVRSLDVHSYRLGIVGKADIVEFKKLPHIEGATVNHTGVKLRGIKGIWSVHPVEYKSGQLRQENSYEIQLCAQAMCLDEMLGVHPADGAIYYGKTGRRLTVVFDPSLRSATERACEQLHGALDNGETPGAKFQPKCAKCSLMDLCIPKAVGQKRSIKSYMEKMTSFNEYLPS